MKKNKFSLKKEYQKSWEFIKQSKKFIYVVIGIFLLFSLIGYFIPAPESLKTQILSFIEQILNKTEGMSQLELIWYIFFNNLKSSFLGMIFGILFGIFPIISSVTNGYIVGFVSFMSVESSGISVLLRLFPHGIFELPAVFISLGLGIKLGSLIFKRNSKKFLKEYLKGCLRVFLTIVIPLLIIVAIIEGTLIAFSM